MNEIKIDLKTFLLTPLNDTQFTVVRQSLRENLYRTKIFGPHFDTKIINNLILNTANQTISLVEGANIPVLSQRHSKLLTFYFEKVFLLLGLGSLDKIEGILRPEYQKLLNGNKEKNDLETFAKQQRENIEKTYSFLCEKMTEKSKFKYSKWFFFCRDIVDRIVESGGKLTSADVVLYLKKNEIFDKNADPTTINIPARKILKKISKFENYFYSEENDLFYKNLSKSPYKLTLFYNDYQHPENKNSLYVLNFEKNFSLPAIKANKKVATMIFATEILAIALSSIRKEKEFDEQNCLTFIKNFFLSEENAKLVSRKCLEPSKQIKPNIYEKVFNLINDNRTEYQEFHELQTKL